MSLSSSTCVCTASRHCVIVAPTALVKSAYMGAVDMPAFDCTYVPPAAITCVALDRLLYMPRLLPGPASCVTGADCPSGKLTASPFWRSGSADVK